MQTTICGMIPFYIYYSMFGLQRIGDLAWAAADMQARGFLLGATSGRTTLAGEGLQHTDGHSHVLASAIPTCRAYDPTYAHEVAVIIQHGLQAMYVNDEAAFYYVTLMNENYPHPGLPEDAADGIVRGMYLLRSAAATPQVQLMGSGAILREVEAAAQMLGNDFDVAADVWSVTSFTELGRDGMAGSALEPSPPGSAGAPLFRSAAASRGVRDRLSPRRTIWRRSRSKSDHLSSVGSSPWAPTASGAATHAQRYAPSSRLIVAMSSSRP